MPATTFASDLKRLDHFADHGSDFGATDSTDYENRARAFLNASIVPGGTIEQRSRSNGELVRYDRATNEFAVMKPNGIIKTYYKPMMKSVAPSGTPLHKMHGRSSNYQYFLDECAI